MSISIEGPKENRAMLLAWSPKGLGGSLSSERPGPVLPQPQAPRRVEQEEWESTGGEAPGPALPLGLPWAFPGPPPGLSHPQASPAPGPPLGIPAPAPPPLRVLHFLLEQKGLKLHQGTG